MTSAMIRGAITKALISINVPVQKDEVKQGFADNSAYVQLIKVTPVRQTATKWIVTYAFDVTYFTLSESEGDDKGDALMVLLDNKSTEDGTIKGSAMSYRYVNHALHFFVSYVVSLYKDVDPDPLMETLSTSGNVKGE